MRHEAGFWSLPKRDWRDVPSLRSEIADKVARVLRARGQ